MPIPFSDTLRLRRKGSFLTQLELARMLGISMQSVNNWENGRTVPPPKRQMDIMRFLNELQEASPPERHATVIEDILAGE